MLTVIGLSSLLITSRCLICSHPFPFPLLFCFQAEDGIRDLVRSRGLGDVYKRQVEHRPPDEARRLDHATVGEELLQIAPHRPIVRRPVSYTHLTLPTSDLV